MPLRKWRPEVTLSRPGWDALTLTSAVLLASHLLLTLLGGYAGNSAIFHELGLSRPGLFAGKFWQLGSYGLLHGNWTHFLANGIMIYLLGGRIVHILGGKNFLKIFWGGVLVGGAFHLLLHPVHPFGLSGELANAPLVGASGGAMALLVALTTLSPDSKMWPVPVSGRNLSLGIMISATLLYLSTPGLSIPLFSSFGAWAVSMQLEGLFQMSHACHLGGALLGFVVIKRLFSKPITLADLQKDRAKRDGEMAA